MDSGVTVQHKNTLLQSLEKGLTHQMDTNRKTQTYGGRGHAQQKIHRFESTRSGIYDKFIYCQIEQSQL